MTEEFYSESLADRIVIDKFVYKGKGRPRKTDYIKLMDYTKKYYHYFNMFLDERAKILNS